MEGRCRVISERSQTTRKQCHRAPRIAEDKTFPGSRYFDGNMGSVIMKKQRKQPSGKTRDLITHHLGDVRTLSDGSLPTEAEGIFYAGKRGKK